MEVQIAVKNWQSRFHFMKKIPIYSCTNYVQHLNLLCSLFCASIDIGHKKYIENFMQLLISIMATKFNHCTDKYNNGKLPLKNS